MKTHTEQYCKACDKVTRHRLEPRANANWAPLIRCLPCTATRGRKRYAEHKEAERLAASMRYHLKRYMDASAAFNALVLTIDRVSVKHP